MKTDKRTGRLQDRAFRPIFLGVAALIPVLLSAFSARQPDTSRNKIHPTVTKVQQIYTAEIGIREKQPNSGPEVEKYLRYVNLSKGNPWCAAFVCWVFGEGGVVSPRSGWSPDLFGAGKVIWDRAENGKRKTESQRKEAHRGIEQRTKSKEQRLPQDALREPGTKSQESRLPQGALGEQGAKNKEQRFPQVASSPPSLATGNWQLATRRRPVTPQTGDVFGIYFAEKKRIAHVGFIDSWDGTWLITVEGNTNEPGSREGDGVYRKRRMVRSIYKVARYIN